MSDDTTPEPAPAGPVELPRGFDAGKAHREIDDLVRRRPLTLPDQRRFDTLAAYLAEDYRRWIASENARIAKLRRG